MNPLDHVDDYPEIPVSLGSTRTVLKTGAWRSVRPVLVERTAPCTVGCPAGVTIPVYLHDVAAGRLDAAFAAFTEHNPFPRITGRVCPHRCEEACNLASVGADSAVSIRAVERWLGDVTADLPHLLPHDPTGIRVAVVGSGPAGLAAAYYLRRTGHDVTVFEKRRRPGGMLRHAIPDYRLPAAVVDAEVGRLEEMGIGFRTGVELGVDLSLEDLTASYPAVFVATGAWKERVAGVTGEELLTPGLEFLEGVSRGEVALPGWRCAVVGGGNTAMDVARVLRMLGAEVTVLYRRTEDEMPAIPEEYRLAVADGVAFEWLSLPRSVERRAGELVVTVEEMRLGDPDESGRRRPEATGSTRQMNFDGVFAAIGETADLSLFPDRLKNSSGWLAAGPTGATADASVYVGGDLVTGPATVIEAIVAGRAAARAIDQRLGFEDRWPTDRVADVVGSDEVHPANRRRHARVSDPRSGAADPLDEETTTISSEAAFVEIERCLSCGHCNECGVCLVLCPDAAIRWDHGPVVDYEFCKGCGICVAECSGNTMVLITEREFTHA